MLRWSGRRYYGGWRRPGVFLWAVGGALLLLALLLLKFLWGWSAAPPLAPDALLSTAIQNTLNASSYKFDLYIRKASGEELVALSGERSEPGRVHIKGAMQKSSLEFIQLGEALYLKDPWSEQWITLQTAGAVSNQELLGVQFNPLVLLKFKETGPVKLSGQEKVAGRSCYVLTFRPSLPPAWPQRSVSFLEYRVYIDQEQHYISKLSARAYLPPDNRPGLTLEVAIRDPGVPVQINVPEPAPAS
ncbi:MAG: hypothetical protein ACUVTU_00040 [Desulfurispora sp.]|uniref:hypothetical protein n=1 Tax=Desulfurispora sp. TaxID=3014275 RepID=UPI00404AFA75